VLALVACGGIGGGERVVNLEMVEDPFGSEDSTSLYIIYDRLMDVVQNYLIP
jgi:hypothetical protein